MKTLVEIANMHINIQKETENKRTISAGGQILVKFAKSTKKPH